MFTGLIEEIGIVKSVEASEGSGESFGGIYLTVSAKKILEDIKPGDSVSIDGVCQTVTKLAGESFRVYASKITCEATTFGTFSSGRKVNLERAMAANARFGGHIVQGHVDGRGKIKTIISDGNGVKIEISIPGEMAKYIVARGSVAVDGISLTVVSRTDSRFMLYIIPETIKNTTLSGKVPGTEVNIEVDILAKYVEQMTGNYRTDDQKDDKKLKRVLMEEGYM
jgi:riboflavin synthase